MGVYFIAGGGTDVGKTYVTSLLIRQLRAARRAVVALKPVASGVPASVDDPAFAHTDTACLLDAQGLSRTSDNIEACTPWQFQRPLSPDMAAAAEGRVLALSDVLAWCSDRIAAAPAETTVLIEGVGGVMSPMTSDALNLDVIKALRSPVVLVTGSYLGALSHALTGLETLRAHGASTLAVVLNESANSTVDFTSTLRSLERFAGEQSIKCILRGASCLSPALEIQ